MRIFDNIGILIVTIWLGLIAVTAWENFVGPSANAHADSDQIVLAEGESWMILRRGDTDIGFMHEARTQLETGWLLEYQTHLSVTMLGSEQTVVSSLKASVDQHAVLRTFSGDISAAGNTFRTLGEVHDDTLTVTTYAGKSKSSQSIQLTTPPRLLATAYNQIVAHPDLKKGDRFEETFFDPSSLSMTVLKLTYDGLSEVEVWDEKYSAHRFIPQTAGTQAYTFVDANGSVLIQVFPLEVIGTRVPPEIGRATAMTMRTQVARARQAKNKSRQNNDLSLESAMKLVSNLTGAAAYEDAPNADNPNADHKNRPGQYTISNITEAMNLELESHRQHISEQTPDNATITIQAHANPDAPTNKTPEKPTTAQLEQLLTTTARIDGTAPNIQKLLQNIAPDQPSLDPSTTERAHKIANAVHQAIQPEPNIAVLSASQALELGKGDCTEYTLVTIAALRQAGIPARFVHGVIDQDRTQMIPHQWVQFFDGERFVDLDASRPDSQLSTEHIQLFTSETPEHPHFLNALNQLTIQ